MIDAYLHSVIIPWLGAQSHCVSVSERGLEMIEQSVKQRIRSGDLEYVYLCTNGCRADDAEQNLADLQGELQRKRNVTVSFDETAECYVVHIPASVSDQSKRRVLDLLDASPLQVCEELPGS